MGPYYDIATMQHLSTNPELHERLERARHEQEARTSGHRRSDVLIALCVLAFLVPLTGI